MPDQQSMMSTSSTSHTRTTEVLETDDEFLLRQFRISVQALERVGALAPGEFEQLLHTPARSEDERQLRSAHHERIAKKALDAAQKGLLAEEDFNIWSGRRKEQGTHVRVRFEECYARACTPRISCQRGALTGIVRAYVRLQDDFIAELITRTEAATTGDELLALEQEAIERNFLEFEQYTNEDVAGWPCFPRSTGRFRGATRLRQYFEQRQIELPLSQKTAEILRKRLCAKEYPVTSPASSAVVKESSSTPYTSNKPPARLQRFLLKIGQLFQ